MHNAKSNLSKLVDAIESGAQDEVILARNGKPAARIVPVSAAAPMRRFGLGKGKYPKFDVEAFDALDAEVALLFYGTPPAKP
jgi:antitoxin (DNA-binding transcriptional repressor) of toxin-antitoxin stability system